MRFIEGNETGTGRFIFVWGPAACRTSAGVGRRLWPLVKKEVSRKEMLSTEGRDEGRRYGILGVRGIILGNAVLEKGPLLLGTVGNSRD